MDWDLERMKQRANLVVWDCADPIIWFGLKFKQMFAFGVMIKTDIMLYIRTFIFYSVSWILLLLPHFQLNMLFF